MPNLYYASKNASNSEETFDYTSKELFYFFIPQYQVFKNVGFCFNPAYEVNLISYENQLLEVEKQKSDSDDKFYTKEIKTDISPFMGNIGELITSNLFMESSMGERSKSMVKEILENLKTQTDLPKEELEKYKMLFGKVGDELLRKLLLEKLEKYEKN